jgi:hypothetical protein
MGQQVKDISVLAANSRVYLGDNSDIVVEPQLKAFDAALQFARQRLDNGDQLPRLSVAFDHHGIFRLQFLVKNLSHGQKGRAVELAMENLTTEPERLRVLRDVLEQHIIEHVADVQINGHRTACLPGLLNVSFDGVDADSLLLALPEVALSSGSACTSAHRAPSHVLKAIGISDVRAQGSVRFGLGRFNNEDEIRHVCLRLKEAVKTLRAMAPHRKAGA